MAKDVLEAFDLLLSGIVPSGTETSKAALHRASIKACLESNFGLTGFFRAGSFGHGTSVRGFSDVDYFAVIPAGNLADDSARALRDLRVVLEKRFSSTGVYTDSPAVAVPFGTEPGEHHEIIPAYFSRAENGCNVYGIPNRSTGWMDSSPTGLNSYVNEQNDRLSKRVKGLVRLVKLWNYYSGAGIRSIYIELRVTEYITSENYVSYPIDVMASLRHMKNKALAAMRDPLGLTGYIYPCTDAAKVGALSKLETAVTRAEKAFDANRTGHISEAFQWWDKVYFGKFPAYY